VRGKNILVVAMLLSIALTSMGLVKGGDTATKILVEPSVVKGNPGDILWISINIEKATDLYGWQIKLQYEPGTKVLGALSPVEDGGFLWGPDGTALAYSIDPIGGVVDVGQTILGDWPGTNGDGTLCYIQFVVAEAGESELTLVDTVLLNSNLDEMVHQTRDGFFDGINVELVMINIGARSMHVGDVQEFDVKVQNEDLKGLPLYVKARIDNTRIEDGRTTSLWTGQSYEYPPVRDPIYLYVDGFTAELQGWTEVGVSPFLDAPDDGNYIEGTTNGAQHRWFSFEDFELGDAILDYVQLEGYCDGPYNEGFDYDVYFTGFNWVGSLYGNGAGPEWLTPRWVGSDKTSDLYPALLTEEGINDGEVMIYDYDPDAAGGAGNIVDCLRLYVVFKAGRPPAMPVVDGFTAERAQWTEVGTGPFLDAVGDGNYIEGSSDAAQHRWFTFEDVDVGTSVIDYVQLWGYTDGAYDEAVDYDVYATGFNWVGSLYGTGTPEWVTPRWVGSDKTSDLYPALLTEAGINDLELMVYFYDPEGHGGPGNIVDCIQLEITFKADRVALPLEEPLYVVQPGEVMYLEPLIWPLQPEDVGTYVCTITVYYSYAGTFFNTGDKKVITESWIIRS
jgi:hypothetical protein